MKPRPTRGLAYFAFVVRDGEQPEIVKASGPVHLAAIVSQYVGTDTTVVPVAGIPLPLVASEPYAIVFPNGTALELTNFRNGPIPASHVEDYAQVPDYYLGSTSPPVIEYPFPEDGPSGGDDDETPADPNAPTPTSRDEIYSV